MDVNEIITQTMEMVEDDSINRETENIRHQHPAVLEAGATGIPDSVDGETAKAFAVLKQPGEATEKDLTKFRRKPLTKYQRPKAIQLVDTLPKSAVDKILHREPRKSG